MKYIERTGDIENIYEGTPEEIINLYATLNPRLSLDVNPMTLKINSKLCVENCGDTLAEELVKKMKLAGIQI